MDSLDEQEIESIWQREKKYVDARKIRSVTKEGIQQEILEKLKSVKTTGDNPQSNSDFLIKRKFPEVASKNPNIRKELLKDNIRIIKGREWILRIDEKGKRPKPVFVKVLKSKHQEKEISLAHKLFLQKYYGVPKLKYKFEDNNTIIPLVNYNTGNRVA